ncbi:MULTISPECIES: flotillin family protein [unclassified Pseudovibrio]|uniref:flotillin family protein n=1 Tax=Pseudovibrio TaxID=258255 RepID=UPI000186B8BE|nr:MULTISPECIES: flotillin family protein [unclassified Pseudovibrio]EEA91967.1 band 7 protein [Pseudovibrio sp. JE062]
MFSDTQNAVVATSTSFMELLVLAGVILVALLAIGIVFSRLYTRSSKEVAFVRTGFGGQKVIMNGGAIVLPVLHDIINVNMNTLRLEVRRADEAALITRDRMRVDVVAEFYLRVQPTIESIANAAQTLGVRTMHPEDLKHLIEGKFVDALRAVAAEMAMEELHEQRVSFVQKVQAAVSEDLLKNGLELESVSLTGLDQTRMEYFNPNNAFDAEGLTKLTQEIEERRRKRNDIEQDTEVQIQRKNLDAEQQKLDISREEEYARLEQQRDLEIRRAKQQALIATEQAERRRDAEQAEITSNLEIKQASIASERQVKEQEILKDRALEETRIEKEKVIELTQQDRSIAVSEKSKALSTADAAANEARAVAIKAEEQVVTAREIEVAERQKQVELVVAAQEAERAAISVTVGAEAEKQAAEDHAEAVRLKASGNADQIRIAANAEADAVTTRAEADKLRLAVEAEGKRILNEAANLLSPEQIQMQVKLALIEALPQVIGASVKPMENIDEIKILQVDGLNGAAPVANGAPAEGSSAGLSDQLVNSALRYRSQAPLVDSLLGELGISGATPNEIAKSVATEEKA